MQTIKSLFVIMLVALLGIGNTFAGNHDEKEIRKVASFSAIDVSSGIDLYLRMGDTQKVQVVADDDIIDKIKTVVKDGTLRIYMKQSGWFNIRVNKTRKVYVSVTDLVRLHASAGSDVETEGQLKGEKLSVSASSGSDVKLDVFYRDFSISTSSGSDAKLKGKVKYLKAESSSGSDIHASDLEAKFGKISASSGSDISVTVTEEISASASSGADVRYSGNPEKKDINESSGGDVYRR